MKQTNKKKKNLRLQYTYILLLFSKKKPLFMEICLCILYEKRKCFIFLHTKQYKSLILLVHCDLAIHS